MGKNPRNLTKKQVDKIQIEEGLVFLNYGLPAQEILGPTRGGGEFLGNTTLREIDHDGKRGKTMNMEVIESQDAHIKVKVICSAQQNMRRLVPNADVTGEGDTIKIANPDVNGVVKSDNYIKNVTLFGRNIDGTWKKATVYNALAAPGAKINAVQKAENELEYTFDGHFDAFDTEQKLYTIEEIPNAPADPPEETATTTTEAQSAETPAGGDDNGD